MKKVTLISLMVAGMVSAVFADDVMNNNDTETEQVQIPGEDLNLFADVEGEELADEKLVDIDGGLGGGMTSADRYLLYQSLHYTSHSSLGRTHYLYSSTQGPVYIEY